MISQCFDKYCNGHLQCDYAKTSGNLYFCTLLNPESRSTALLFVMFKHFSLCLFTSLLIKLYTFRITVRLCLFSSNNQILNVSVAYVTWHMIESAQLTPVHLLITADSTYKHKFCTVMLSKWRMNKYLAITASSRVLVRLPATLKVLRQLCRQNCMAGLWHSHIKRK